MKNRRLILKSILFNLMHQSPKGTFLTMREFVDYKDRFELPNLVKAKKKRQQMWGWHKLPDLVEHYKVV